MMRTHSYIAAMRTRRGLSALSVLGGLLLTLQLLMPSVALASSSTPKSLPALAPVGVRDLAGVSVVRLVIAYKLPKPAITFTQCTALGTLIASWAASSATDQNNWVLTDGSILNLTGGSCAPAGSTLATIQVLASSEFTNHMPALTTLGQLTCKNGVCTDQLTAGSGPVETISKAVKGGVLFSFHSDASHLLPFLTVAQEPSASANGIELARTGVWPLSPKLTGTTTTPQDFLDPSLNTQASGNPSTAGTAPEPNEPGMPFVDSSGQVTSMQLAGANTPLQLAAIQSLETAASLTSPPISTRLGQNTLKTQWETGITQYEQGQFSQAQQTLAALVTQNQNPSFQAPQAFEQLAANSHQGGNGSPSASPTPGNGQAASSFLGIPLSWVWIVALIAGVMVLVLLFVLVSLVFGRKRVERKQKREELERFKVEEVEARRIAERDARRMAEMGSQRQYAQPVGTAAPPPQAQPPVAPAPQAQPPAQSISEYPTVEMSPRNGAQDTDKTLPYDVQQLLGRNLSLAVGYESDPGIKRKHKPNEDSLFAIQGARTHNSQPQQFGLFVVADGMGGHANGQDASRLAIQNIIDFMLPRISTTTVSDEHTYLKLLEEGVQCANQAVHQRNLEERADMGTTMTAALVIGATAYVANVGDSRTYLYREPEGLTKITHDHSVVASLVDAGIIKPDDIYTHPKRNQIYRSLGEKPVVEVDSFKVPLQVGDKLLLCSDGLWDMVRDPEIQRVISTPAPNPTETGKELIQAALNSGGEDNVSVIVVSITEAAGHTGMTGIQLLAKPESVTVPDLPPM